MRFAASHFSPVRERSPWLRVLSALSILLAMGVMVWTRLRAARALRGSDEFLLIGIDSYYHYRTIGYTLRNWPNTMPFEVWTSFPSGTYVGQFGTAYDQVIATVLLVMGGGTVNEELAQAAVPYVGPVMAALVVIPVYLIGRELAGRWGGIAGIALLAVFPGQIFTRTVFGQVQHHGAELVLMGLTVYGFVRLARATDRDGPGSGPGTGGITGLTRRELLLAALAGVALASYQWIWPPGVLLVGIIGVWFVLYYGGAASVDRDVEALAAGMIVSMGVTAVLVLVTIETTATGATNAGPLGAFLAASLAIGALSLVGMDRAWTTVGFPRWGLGLGIAGVIGLYLLGLWIVRPELLFELVGNLQGRVLPIGHEQADLTISEAQPPENYLGFAFREFGPAFYTGLLGFAALAVTSLRTRPRAEHALILVWALFLLSMSMTQARFFYYLALVIAVGNAVMIGRGARVVQVGAVHRLPGSARLQRGVLVVGAVLVLVGPLVLPVVGGPSVMTQPAHPHSATMRWQESLDHLSESTPPVGTYGNASNELPYYGTFHTPPDRDFRYPDGAYGVLSWWTYGHLITTEGERIPVANPFQSGARAAATFLLANSEAKAEGVLTDLAATGSVRAPPTPVSSPGTSVPAPGSDGESVRFVMVDSTMATFDFETLQPWAVQKPREYVVEQRVRLGAGSMNDVTLPSMGQAYHNTTLARLYLRDASRMAHYRLVHESTATTDIASIARERGETGWESLAVQVDLSQVDATVEAVRSVPGLAVYDEILDVPQVKTFERVPGATIRGTSEAAPGSQVLFQLRLRTNASQRNFTYSQRTTVQENGRFVVTVPYATTEELGPAEGYTETAVQAQGPFTVTITEDGYVVERGEVAVPESAVYAGDVIHMNSSTVR